MVLSSSYSLDRTRLVSPSTARRYRADQKARESFRPTSVEDEIARIGRDLSKLQLDDVRTVRVSESGASLDLVLV